MIQLKVKFTNQNLRPEDQNVMDLFTKDSIGISAKQWHQYRMQDHCQKIVQWSIHSLVFIFHHNQSFLFTISTIRFPQLKILILSHCHVSSLEEINRISMPSLEELYIRSNNINSIKSLRKSNWTALKVCWASKNVIKDLETSLEWASTQLENLKFDCAEPLQSPEDIQSNDLRWLAKLKPSKMKWDPFESKRIQQASLIKCLERKLGY